MSPANVCEGHSGNDIKLVAHPATTALICVLLMQTLIK